MNSSSDNGNSMDQFSNSLSDSSDDSSLGDSERSTNESWSSSWFLRDNVDNVSDSMDLSSDLSNDSSQDMDLFGNGWSFCFWNSWEFDNQLMDGVSDDSNLLSQSSDCLSEVNDDLLLLSSYNWSSWSSSSWVLNSDNGLFDEGNVLSDLCNSSS